MVYIYRLLEKKFEGFLGFNLKLDENLSTFNDACSCALELLDKKTHDDNYGITDTWL